MKDLEFKDDIFLVKRMQKHHCNDSLRILISRHSSLCYKIYKKYIPSFNVKNIDINEIFEQKDYIIYKSALSFKENKKAKFSTWLGNQIRYQCLNAINKKENISYMDNIELSYLIDRNQHTNNKKLEELKDYISSLLHQLKDDRISKIFNMRYFECANEQTWTKISKKMNMSTQNAINLHNKGLQILKNKLTSKDLFDKI